MVQNHALNDSPRKQTLQQVTDTTREKSAWMTQCKGSTRAHGSERGPELASHYQASWTVRETASRALDPWILPTLPGTLIPAVWCGKTRCTGRSVLTKDDTGLWAKSCPGQPLFIPLRMALSSKCSRWEVSTWGGDTGHGGPGASRACSPAPQLWPQDAKAFFSPTGNKVWFQKETRKGIQDFTGMTMSKKQEHVRYLTCTLRRHKCQDGRCAEFRNPFPATPFTQGGSGGGTA